MAQQNDDWEQLADAKVEGWETLRPRMQQPSIYAPKEEWARYRAAQQQGEAAPAPTATLRSEVAPGSPMQTIAGVGKTLAGMLLEAPATIATGAVATPVAGMAGLARTGYGLATGRPPEQALAQGAQTVQAVQQGMTYQPRTQAGQAATAMLSAPFEAAAQGAEAAGGAVGQAVGGEQGRIAGEVIGRATPEVALTAAGGRSMLRAQQPTGPVQFTQAEDAVRNAQRAGFRALPTEVRGGTMNVAAESVAKQAPLVKRLVQYNERRAGELAKQDLGLAATDRLDEPTIQRVKDRAGGVYDQVRALPDTIDVLATDPSWISRVIDLDSRFRSIKSALPELYDAARLERLRGGLARLDTVTPEQVIDISRNLRDSANRTLKNPNASDDAANAAYAFKQGADMLEGLLETYLQSQPSTTYRAGLVERFRRARELYAKAYNVEEATNLVTGTVDPQALRRAMEKGQLLTGNLRTVAEAAASMPSVVRKSEGLVTPEGMVLSDWAMGAGIPAAIFSGQPGIAAGLAAGAAARPAVRAAVASGPYQRRFAQPAGAVPRPPAGASVPGMVAAGVAAQPERPAYLMSEETE